LGVTLAGAVQLYPLTGPLHANWIAAAKPFSGVMMTGMLPLVPWVIVTVEGADKVKSGSGAAGGDAVVGATTVIETGSETTAA
jgi:hypothetical protein